MGIEAIDHVNIRTTDVPATARFFADVLGMKVTPSPGTDDPAKGIWIRDAEGRAVVHVAHLAIAYPWEAEPPSAPAQPGSGRVHHVALRCSGYEEMRARLEKAGVAFETNDIDTIGLRQLFVAETNGVLLELNFSDG